jgi:hypothetical protein
MPATVARTHCPTCGARLARPDLSICAYCTTPLGLEQERREPTETMQRLARMAQHERWGEAMAWTPPAELEDEQATRFASRGLGLVGIGAGLLVLAVAWALLSGGLGRVASTPAALLGWVALLAGGAFWIAGRVLRARAMAAPLLARAARVASRRSETALGGPPPRTVYFFQLEFADGSEGEFRFPGRSSSDELLVAGNTGVAYTRRDKLLAFKELRV